MTNSAIRDAGGTIACLAPDVCLTPVGPNMVPLPYMIISQLDWSVRTEPKILFGGKKAFTMNSRTNKVTGDEPGTGGGVKSGVTGGWCRPQSNKTNFLVAGFQVIQHDCIYEMNCAGPEGPGNTVGKILYFD
ncbi:MAG: hypothetical protein RLZZ437_2223 [Pseudomonadota bacterium]|jgi:hypothetical protein